MCQTTMPVSASAPIALKMWDIRGGQVSGSWYNEADQSTRSISADPKIITLSSVPSDSEKKYPYTVVFEVGKAKKKELTFMLHEEHMDKFFNCTKSGKLKQAQALNQASLDASAYAVLLESTKRTMPDELKLMWRECERQMYGGERTESKARPPTKAEIARGVMKGIKNVSLTSPSHNDALIDAFECGLVREDQKWWSIVADAIVPSRPFNMPPTLKNWVYKSATQF